MLLELIKRRCFGHTYLSSQMATDLKDLLYGIFGLALDHEKLELLPDHNNTTQEVYTEAMQALIRQGHTIVLAWYQSTKNFAHLPQLCARLLFSPPTALRRGQGGGGMATGVDREGRRAGK
jgi:hypothetical protein